jgi:hypothetical protein
MVCACALAVFLLLAQALGLAHGIGHAGGLPPPVEDLQHEHHGGVHEAGSEQCRLVDAHAAADLASVAPLAALPRPMGRGDLPQPAGHAAFQQRVWAAPARGPPPLPR